MSNIRLSRGFTLIELLVVISIIALLISILLPALGSARRAAQQMQNSTQLRGIHQGMYIFSQENKGYFPGLDNEGQPLTGQGDTAHITDQGATFRTTATGPHPLRRLAVMLDSDLFPTEYMIAPADTARELPDPNGTGSNVRANNYSYAMLEIELHDVQNDGSGTRWRPTSGTWLPSDRGLEWQDTTNSAAILMSDRAIADSGTAGNALDSVINYHSLWTKQDSGSWAGSVLRNDGSVQHGLQPDGFTTQYGNGASVQEDNIFLREEGAGIDNESNAVIAPGPRTTLSGT